MSKPIPETQYINVSTREEVIDFMTSTPERNNFWIMLPEDIHEEIIAIYMKQKILKLTYDRVFKFVFDLNLHPGRLDAFVSQILKREVKIIRVLPLERNNYFRHSKQIYLDILVEFSDHSQANIEMQILGYKFPNTRAAIYSSSLILGQYTDLCGQYMYATGISEIDFSDQSIDYSKIHKVYTIVLMEHSTEVFRNVPGHYLHHSHQAFNTGLEMDMLQEYIFIALDSFHDLVPDPSNELEAWLAFVSARTLTEIDRVILKFPSFQTIKDDVIMYGETQPEEVLRMYLDCLDLFDYNDRLQDLKETKAKVEQLEKEVAEKEAALAQKDDALAQKDNALAQKDDAFAQILSENARLKAQLAAK